MKQITITLNVPENVQEIELHELQRQCEMLSNPDHIAVFWSLEDVKDVASHLDENQAREVLHAVLQHHDATIGINWEVLETVAEDLFPLPDEEDEDEDDDRGGDYSDEQDYRRDE